MVKRRAAEREDGAKDLETGEGSSAPIFGAKPVLCACVFCENQITTQVKRKAGWFSRVSAVLCVLLGFNLLFGLVLGAVVYQFTKHTVHKCPECLNTVRTVPAFEFLGSAGQEKDELWSFRLGAMAVIVTKRYVYMAGMTVLALVLVYSVSRRFSGEFAKIHIIGPLSALTVEEYVGDCGQTALNSNPIRCMQEFPRKYQDHSFNWSGRVKSINEGFDAFFFRVDNFLDVQILDEDFIAFFPSSLLPAVAELQPGDHVNLHATLASYGAAHGMYLHSVTAREAP